MTYRVYATQPSGVFERVGQFDSQVDAERAATAPGFHVVDAEGDVTLIHHRTDERVVRAISMAIDKGKHPAFGHEPKPAPRLLPQPKRGPIPEHVEVFGVSKTRDEWAKDLGVTVSAIYQSATSRKISYGDEVARRNIEQSAERTKRAPKTDEPSAAQTSPAEEREDWGGAFVREVEEAFAPVPVEASGPIAAQEPERRPQAKRPAVAPTATTNDATQFAASVARLLSAVLEHGSVDQLLDNAAIGRRAREHNERAKEAST